MDEKLKKKLKRQQELLDLARAEGRDLTAEEKTEFDGLQREIDELKHEPEGNEDDMQRGIQVERQRVADITELCRQFGMESTEFIRDGKEIEEVRSAVLNHLAENDGPIPTGTRVRDEADKFREAAVDALLLRAGIELEKPADGARDLRGMSLRDLGIEALQREDTNLHNLNRHNSDEIFTALRQYNSPTAAFPAIMDNAIEKSLEEGYRTVPVTFDEWTHRGTLKDFKTHDNKYVAGPAGEFLEVPEGGEIKHDTLSHEKKPTRKLRTYGRQFTLTREAFINDDIEIVTGLPKRYAESARKTINKQCYEILVNNSVIYDGQQLCSAGHKNLVAQGTGITIDAIQTMILALQNQEDEFGEVCLMRPAVIIVPIGYAFEMYTLFNSPTINTSENTQAVNPLYAYRGKIKVVEDPTINALASKKGNNMPWWLIADKSDSNVMEVDYLNGNDKPLVRRMESPGKLGYVWDIILDWGISVMDYRGIVGNPGIPIESKLKMAE